jgi:hypothetical protein
MLSYISFSIIAYQFSEKIEYLLNHQIPAAYILRPSRIISTSIRFLNHDTKVIRAAIGHSGRKCVATSNIDCPSTRNGCRIA